jgi:hypothetical protein
VPQPAGSFATTLCVEQVGDAPCPSTDYINKTLFYQSVDDLRGCSTCTCTPSGASCAKAAVNTYTTSNGSCGGMPITYNAPFTCDPISADHDVMYTVTPTAGTCTANPVTPSGTATPTEPITVCCL